MSEERAVLAGGGFWGVQELVRKLPGVLSTRVGYTGGDVPNATYRNHGTHAEAIADVEASGIWPGSVVTEVEPVGPFWDAEPEHQDYLQRYPNGYTCHFVRPGWKVPVRDSIASKQAHVTAKLQGV